MRRRRGLEIWQNKNNPKNTKLPKQNYVVPKISARSLFVFSSRVKKLLALVGPFLITFSINQKQQFTFRIVASFSFVPRQISPLVGIMEVCFRPKPGAAQARPGPGQARPRPGPVQAWPRPDFWKSGNLKIRNPTK